VTMQTVPTAVSSSGDCNLNDTMLCKKLERLCWLAFESADCDMSRGTGRSIISDCIADIHADLLASHARDLATRHAPVECLLSVHATFFAVLSYRLASTLISSTPEGADSSIVNAMRLSFSARARTGVEIHPQAVIGRRLIIDHGWGTVIGQTVEIGDDAYILNNVILGGRAIGDAADGKRHPTLGHRVQISAGVRILGPVLIGDDSFIGPDAVITHDLPANSRIIPHRTVMTRRRFQGANALAAVAIGEACR